MVRYYGLYSNKSKGMRLKQGINKSGGELVSETDKNVEILDVSDYQPKRIPSRTWRECIKKVLEIDPLRCPICFAEMSIVSFITEQDVIKRILDHLGLWIVKPSRDPPAHEYLTDESVVREPFNDGWPGYDEPCVVLN
jgi:hypothetical protein